MFTAKQAYANHVRWKVYSGTEKFVHSVLELVITDDQIRRRSMYEKEISFSLDDLFYKIFICKEKKYGEYMVIGWQADCSDYLPSELEGKHIRELIKELEQVYEVDPQISFICKCFKALIYELQDVRGFKVRLDLERHALMISWDLSLDEDVK